jgi:addiction module HigA family antidote
MKAGDTLPPLHPGEMLREEFMIPLGLTAYALAKAMHVPRTRVERLIREETSITPDTALRLSRAIGWTPEVWLGLQADYDLEVARGADDGDLADIPNLNPHRDAA